MVANLFPLAFSVSESICCEIRLKKNKIYDVPFFNSYEPIEVTD